MGVQVGFVMCLDGQRLSAALEDYLPDYEFAFEGNGSELGGMFYHTDRTRQLNAHFGDMLHKIQDLEVSTSCNHLQTMHLTWRCRCAWRSVIDTHTYSCNLIMVTFYTTSKMLRLAQAACFCKYCTLYTWDYKSIAHQSQKIKSSSWMPNLATRMWLSRLWVEQLNRMRWFCI